MGMVRLLFIFLLLFSAVSFADDTNTTINESEINQKILILQEKITQIEKDLKNNIWTTRYSNFISYNKLLEELELVQENIKKFKSRKDEEGKKLYNEAFKNQETLTKQIALLKEYENSPFEEFINTEELKDFPRANNPITMISALSYLKQLKQNKDDYKAKLKSFSDVIGALEEREKGLNELYSLNKSGDTLKLLLTSGAELKEFWAAREIFETSFEVYTKKVDEITLIITEDVKIQLKKAFNISIAILFVIALALIAKRLIKKYITDDERFYMANKIINFINLTLIILIIIFSYIENVNYLITVLGFASAGLAIAMKDMFMSMLGWFVIVFSGAYHVGDRVRVQKDGAIYIGDIIDISLLKMTIYEDITLTTYLTNRRAGRVIFIPNNYIFSMLISNYTHETMKNVWDGIDFTITFDSNHKKTVHIVREIVRKFSKNHTDIARKQMGKLRSQYSLKNINIEPRIFTFLEPNGIKISAWYLVNSYSILGMRSAISAEIIDSILREDDIKIAYPTQTMNIENQKNVSNSPILPSESPKDFFGGH